MILVLDHFIILFEKRRERKTSVCVYTRGKKREIKTELQEQISRPDDEGGEDIDKIHKKREQKTQQKNQSRMIYKDQPRKEKR